MLLFNKNCPQCGNRYDKTLSKCPSCQYDNDIALSRHFNKNVVFLQPGVQIGLFLLGFSYVGMLGIEILLSIFIPLDNLLGKTLLTGLTYIILFVSLLAIAILDRKFIFAKKFTRLVDYLFGFGYAGILILVGNYLPYLISWLSKVPIEELNNTNQETAIDMIKYYPIFSFFFITILGPVCEEITYRVGLYSFLKRINTIFAFLVTVIIFAFIHFSFKSETMKIELLTMPIYIVLGLMLTLAYEHRGPACSITAHIVYNGFAFFSILYEINHG